MNKKKVVFKKDAFFRKMSHSGLALSYDDVRLKTGHSEVEPAAVNLSTKFSRNVPLNNPIVSSPMDTVTESDMAIEMAQLGGLGIIHRALLPKEQSQAVAKVKFYLNGLIKKPICINQDEKVGDVLKTREEKGYKFHTFPVLDEYGRFVGLVTQNDFEFCIDRNLKVRNIMSVDLKCEDDRTTVKKAFDIMRKNKKKVLPLLDQGKKLVGMYIFSDVKRIMTGSSAQYNIDANGNLRVGAAVGVGDDALERVELLANKNIDVVVIDTAHGDSKQVIKTLKEIKKLYPQINVVVGNVSEGHSAKILVDAGADGIKVGQGPGSICTTRIIAGIGHPQVSAVYECSKAIRGSGVPVCADGGIKYSGDITIAIGAGADSVMLGNMLAGTKETPGDIVMIQGAPYKNYRGMGSLGAMEKSKASRERYLQAGFGKDKLVPEGVEGIVPFKGPVLSIIYQNLGGLRSGMGYAGAADIKELQLKADFHRISGAGLSESHPHGVIITKEAPNYKA
jgi:IMP dehydrogenase